MGFASLYPSYKIERNSIPGDDLAFALMNIRRVEQISGAAAHQKFRAAGADRVVAAAARRGFAGLSSGNCGSAKISLQICQAEVISSASELTPQRNVQ